MPGGGEFAHQKNCQGVLPCGGLSGLELTDTLWLDFRTIDENSLHGTGRRIENASEGITLQIEKKGETAGNLNAYIYLIMDAQLNIENGKFVSALY